MMGLVLCSILLSAPVQVKFEILPAGHDYQLKEGPRVRYYLLSEYLKLAEGDSELVLLRAEVKGLDSVILAQERQLAAQERVIQTLERDRVTFAERAERLQGKLDTCEDDLVAASNPYWQYVLAVGGSVIGIVGITWGLASSM